MKAKIKTGPLLTVGMIIKNEERHLQNCLEAVRRLFERIPGELIIADTGSTDRSVEIAREYADQVFHFEWCDDFSAARNAVIKKARGQWYLSLDADEYIDENVDELVEFLTAPESKNYNTGTILVRNYSNQEKQGAYSDFNAIRLFRRSSQNHFIGRIHEALFQIPPIRTISTVLHHYGYAFESPEEKEEKHQRNMKLILEELDKKPDDLRLLVEAAESCYENGEEIDYLERGVALTRKAGKFNAHSGRCYFLLIKSYTLASRYEEAAALGEELFEGYIAKSDSVVQLDLYYISCLMNVKKGDLKEALRFYHKYENYLQRIVNGQADLTDMIYFILESNAPEPTRQIREAAMKAAMYLEDSESLSFIFDYLGLESYDAQKMVGVVNSSLQLVQNTNNAHLIRVLYGTMRACINTGDEQESFKWTTFYYLLERFYLQNPDLRPQIVEEFLKSPDAWQEDELIRTMQLAAAEGEPGFADALQSAVAEISDWSSVWTVVYYLAIKYVLPLPEEATIKNKQRSELVLDHMAASFQDFPYLLIKYHEAIQMDDLSQRQWMVLALEKALLACKNLNDEELYLKLIDLTGDYVNEFIHQLYQQEILCDEAIGVLPPMHQFGFYYHRALERLKRGDESGYLHNLKTLIEQNQHAKDLVGLVRFVLDKQEAEKKKKEQDFQQLALAFKGKIKQLVEMGLIVEAHTMLEKYILISPQDQEALDLWNSLNVEPSGPVS